MLCSVQYFIDLGSIQEYAWSAAALTFLESLLGDASKSKTK